MATITVDDVRQAIRDSGLTQQELSAKTGLAQPTISDFLAGRTGAELGKWLQLLSILGLAARSGRRKKA
jgi:predicted transcriptional regulator